ncbi:MAG TPA: amino acid ABC transporter ATP-binding protein [Bacilli bacterium]|nr:amino acid ABC transporter ATP-binding protein [Bacilli bacterium]
MAYLTVTNINKSFNNLKVLDNISFSLEKGETLVIIGSSGSGKTTLLRCLNFLEKVDSGSIQIEGKTIIGDNYPFTDKEIRSSRMNFGLVFQSFNLFPHYNILKNVMLAPQLSLGKKTINREEYKQKLDQTKDEALSLLETMGLSDKINAFPYQLSGGQQQRVAIARALILKPKILCFDEPTSALDPALTNEVVKVINHLKTQNRTMIVVTHEMNFASKIADKVIFMAEGKIFEVGTPDDIFNNPRSQKLISFLKNN